MKVFAGLVVIASATVERIGLRNSWPANPDAPHCGCQMIVDPNLYGGLINSTCTIRFPYAAESKYGFRSGKAGDPHFVSIASTYMVGRNRDDRENGIYGPDAFRFTGFDEVSNPDVLDILVFYEQKDCFRADFDESTYADLSQDRIWEAYNLTKEADGITDVGQEDYLCEFTLNCDPTDDGYALPGVHLGNFNYDIARSVQTYTAPIYGLPKNDAATFGIVDYYNRENNCMNALAHHGHGSIAEGSCSNNATGECGNTITFNHDQNHNGLLEYFQFEPVSLANNPLCFDMPEHHTDDYKWDTPSPWDTQENFMSTPQNAQDNEDYENSL